MAALRALCIFVALVGFFLIGTPLQWLIAHVAPRAADRIPIFFCRSLLRLLRVRTTIEGSWPASGPTLVVANHVSWIDILALGGIRPFCFLAKHEVSRWPILSAFAEVQGTVFVDRKRRRTIPPANRMMARRMLEGRSVLLFPEGTTVDAAEPGPFLSSHLAAARDLLRMATMHDEVAVQPVAVAYSSPRAAWVGDDDLLSHLWRTLRGSPLECRITVTPPLAFRATSDRKVLAARARGAIITAQERQRCAVVLEASLAGVGLVQPRPSGC